ncbi:MAG: mechanosensitive ion channel family protein [Oscillospiraceae bacterium]|nr:mechanosensitive ion channel family protein [Oscillospiraceae bacterium]
MHKLTELIMSSNFWISVAIIIGMFGLWFLLKQYIEGYMRKEKISGRKATNTHVAIAVAKYIILVFAAVTVLQINGVNVSSIITGFGVAGIIVGFALQDILKDLIMGVNVVWDNFFSVGDIVRYKNVEGKVVFFNLKVTKIYDVLTGNIFTVCNRNISEIEKISDWLDIVIPTSYEEDAARMRTTFKKICEEIEHIGEVKSCEFLGTDAFAESSVNYRLRVHCHPERKRPVYRAALGIVQDVFAEEKISIPYPQLDVHAKP